MIMYVQVKVFIDHDELAAQNSLHLRQRTTRYTARELTARIWLTRTLRPTDHDACRILYTICLSLAFPLSPRVSERSITRCMV